MISRTYLCHTLVVLALAAGTITAAEPAKTASARLVELRIDDLNSPLGIDDLDPTSIGRCPNRALRRSRSRASYTIPMAPRPMQRTTSKRSVPFQSTSSGAGVQGAGNCASCAIA